jgi:hypothetical protein
MPTSASSATPRRSRRRRIWIGKVNHKSYLALGTCWSAGCHTAIHGSNFQPRMLY